MPNYQIDPNIISALISSFIALVISIIGIYCGRKEDKRKIWNELRRIEIENRLLGLQEAITTLQALKNELRYIVQSLQLKKQIDYPRSYDQISQLKYLLDRSYSKHLPSRLVRKIC